MPKRQEKSDYGKAKKPQESSDITIELQDKNKSFSWKNKDSSEEEKMSNLNNLVDAARIVEGNESQELPKKGKGKAARKKEPSKMKRKVRGVKSDKGMPSKGKDAESSIGKFESISDSDSERENEIASLKNTMSVMMAKLERLENSKRKRKSKKHKKEVGSSSDEEKKDYIKPTKSSKKESEHAMKSKSVSENTLSVTPDYGMPNMKMLNQYQQLMMMQQQMMYNQPHPSFVFPSVLHMLQAGGINTSIPRSAPLPTNTMTQKKPSADNTSENSDRSSTDKYEDANLKTERKKQEKSSARSSVEKDLSRDDGESDASEVYEPSMKVGTFEKYLSAAGPNHPTKSFLGFVDEINNEQTRSIQSRVVSSTKRNSEKPKFKKSSQDEKKQGMTKRENKTESDMPPSNIAGILMNLMPNQLTNNIAKEDSDSKDRPQINNTLKSLFGYTFESNAMNKAAENIMAKQNKLSNHPPYSNKSEHYHSSGPDRPPETKRYVDNTEWMRDSIRNLYLQDQDGDTILHILIAKEEEAMAVDVIKRMKGYKLDILNALGQTPLHLALYTKHVKVIETLLQHGADISIVDAHGNSPIHIACEEDSLHMLKVLFEYQIGNRERYDKILQIRNNQGMAAIHIATNQANLSILKFLATQNVDLNIQESRSGNTPLLMALAKNHWTLAEFFINNGSNVNIPNFSNNYPLHLAVQGNNMEMVKALLMKGAEAGSKANEYENGGGSSEIKSLLAKEMRKRRRHRHKNTEI